MLDWADAVSLIPRSFGRPGTIRGFLAVNAVVARSSGDPVIASIRVDDVSARQIGDDVVAIAGRDVVVSVPAIDRDIDIDVARDLQRIVSAAQVDVDGRDIEHREPSNLPR